MPPLNAHAKDLALFWQGRILWNSPMARFSTFKVGGPAEAIIPVTSTEDLIRLIRWLKDNDINWRVIGKGSNILVPDSGLAGVTIILDGEFNSCEMLSATTSRSAKKTTPIRAGGGCPLPKLVSFCTSRGLSGLEFAIGIPGSLGGAIVMNAGAWGYEIGELVEDVVLMAPTGKVYAEEGKILGFSYRKWSMPGKTVLLFATLAVQSGNRVDIKKTCQKYREFRRKNQPVAEASAGSFFKNPPADSAGRLIEEAGLKGYVVGGAKISEKHANFIVNTGKASASDILNLMQVVQDEVYKRFGIRLEPEVHILAGE